MILEEAWSKTIQILFIGKPSANFVLL
jgi:hypothetical protein